MAEKPIVAATDGSEESLRAVDWAAREAELRGLPLRIVSAAALPPPVRRIARALPCLRAVLLPWWRRRPSCPGRVGRHRN